MSAYTEIRITAPITSADDITALLCEQELAFQEADATTLEPPPAGQSRFHLFIPPSDAPEILALLHASLALPPDAITWHARDEAEWRDTWKQHFTTRRIGCFAIVPSWEAAAHHPEAHEVTLHLDPGRAFGTGGHASTRLCLRFIDLIVAAGAPSVSGAEVLDVGTGCGILAIAALRSGGYQRGLAIDIDPEAVEVTEENAERNGVTRSLTAATTPLPAVPGRYALVLANITGPTIHELARSLADHVAPGGSLVLAGILQTEAEGIAARMSELGLRPATETPARLDEEEWAALHLMRAS